MTLKNSAGLVVTLFASALASAQPDPGTAHRRGASSGPDVTIIDLDGISEHHSSGSTELGFSIGTNSCNIGDAPLNWCDEPGGCGGLDDSQHPVIAGNLYRVKEGRLEQLGKSWLKHGFFSTNSFDNRCGSCSFPPLGGSQLGTGCTDFYDSGLNGSRPLGLRSEVNPTSGVFPFPETMIGGTDVDQQIRVAIADLEPGLNTGATYYMEGHYVVDDDAAAITSGLSNAFNNASYRQATVQGTGTGITMSFVAGPTVREQSALYAWQAEDPGVEIVNVDFTNGSNRERFEVARKVTFDSEVYTTVLAIRNMNSHTAARALTVSFPLRGSAGISSTGMTDVDDHSGAPYATADWTADTSDPQAVEWSTETFAQNNFANALRWSTTYTFWFESAADPGTATYEIGLFRPSSPSTLVIPFGLGPVIFTDGFETGDVMGWSAASQ